MSNREYYRARRARFRAESRCLECGEDLGGEGGTSIRCPVCAELHRSYYRKERIERQVTVPKPSASARIGKMLALSEKLSALDRLRRA